MSVPAAPQWATRVKTLLNDVAHTPFMSLATVKADLSPANRTIVFRGWSGDSGIRMCADSRSAKIGELDANPNAELCWYFPDSWEQFRLSGPASVVTHDTDDVEQQAERREVWIACSAKTREQFAWPHPLTGEAEPNQQLEGDDPHNNFAALVLHPNSVLHLSLKGAEKQGDPFPLLTYTLNDDGEWNCTSNL